VTVLRMIERRQEEVGFGGEVGIGDEEVGVFKRGGMVCWKGVELSRGVL
jgi:hypothetical protein